MIRAGGFPARTAGTGHAISLLRRRVARSEGGPREQLGHGRLRCRRLGARSPSWAPQRAPSWLALRACRSTRA
eukprot:2985020-Heterocapsa_arctica.AAC.1